MLSRKHRFHGHNSVMRVRGKSLPFSYGRFVFAKNPKRHDYRVAIVVSKKVAKSAVVRNRVRRRIFEAIRTCGRLEGLAVDVVVLVSSDQLATADSPDISMQVDAICARIESEYR